MPTENGNENLNAAPEDNDSSETATLEPGSEFNLFPRDIEAMPATNYVSFVTQILARDSRRTKSPTISQTVLRDCINLASSFLVTDTTTDPQEGISTWFLGLDHLVDLVVVLHNKNELELETVDCASRACSECWTAAGNWRGLDECRVKLRTIGGKLKKILDPNEKTYKGGRVYAP